MEITPEQREAMERYLEDVRALVAQVSANFPAIAMSDVVSLVEHGEAPEGMRELAWAISRSGVSVPENVVLSIRKYSAGFVDESDLPADLDDFIISEG